MEGRSLKERLYSRWFFMLEQRPKIILAAIAFIALFAIAGLPQLTFSSDFRVYFSDDNPQLSSFEAMERDFSKQDNIAFLVSHPDQSVFQNQGFDIIYRLTELGWQLPFSQRVDSLQNQQWITATEEGIEVNDFFLAEQIPLLQQPDFQRLLQQANADETIRRRLIDDAGSTALVNVLINLPADNPLAANDAMLASTEIQQEFSQLYPGWNIKRAGSIPSNTSMATAIALDIQTLIPFAYVVMLLVMIVLLRSLTAVILITAMIGLSIVTTLGIFGWLGYQLTPPTGFVPIAVMTIAVADAIHILITFYHQRRQQQPVNIALRESLRINFMPVLITSITTILGVLCLNSSDSPPYRDMGNMIAVGVGFAWLFTLTFLPACLLLAPSAKKQYEPIAESVMSRFANLITNAPRRCAGGVIVLVIGCAFLIPNNRLTESWHEFFDDGFEVRQATNHLQQTIGGLHALFMVTDSGRSGGISEPEFLLDMDRFCTWLRSHPMVNQVNCLSDTIKNLHQKMQADDPTEYRIPDSPQLAAQLLLLYELSLPSGLGLDTQMTYDQRRVRLQINLKQTDSTHLLQLEDEFYQWAKLNTPALNIHHATGLDIVFANLTYRNIIGMLLGTGLALAMISIVLFFALSSLKLGLLSLIPNLFPAIVAYGVWAVLYGEVDTAASVVACLSLGIIVDDTVHFLCKYRYAREQLALNTKAAIHYAFRTVGLALIITTAILVGGFITLHYSNFNPTKIMGWLLAITLLSALIIDFLLLPILLMKLEKIGWIRWDSSQQTRLSNAIK